MSVKRRGLALFLVLLGLFAPPARAEEAEGMPEALYAGIAQANITIRASMDRSAKAVGYYAEGATVLILAYEPEWLQVVKGDARHFVTGYVLRHTVSGITSLDGATLPYGAVPSAYIAVIDQDTALLSAPQAGAAPLFTLPKGVPIAITEMRDGFGKVPYFRLNGYLYLGDVAQLTPVYGPDTALPGDALSAFVTFYSTDTSELNVDRTVNLRQACAYISQTLAPGERFAFDSVAGPYRPARGYREGISFLDGETVLSYGGGVCQVSTTLYNALLSLDGGIRIVYRRPHGPSGATYVPHGVDAAVGNERLDLVFENQYAFPVRIEAIAEAGVLYVALWRE